MHIGENSCINSNDIVRLGSLLVEFRKRLNEEAILSEIGEMIIAYNAPDDPTLTPGDESQSDTDENAGILILDDTCDRFCHYKLRVWLSYIRPIMRGKASAQVEFGAKLDLSLNEKGMAQIEKCHLMHTTKVMS